MKRFLLLLVLVGCTRPTPTTQTPPTTLTRSELSAQARPHMDVILANSRRFDEALAKYRAGDQSQASELRRLMLETRVAIAKVDVLVNQTPDANKVTWKQESKATEAIFHNTEELLNPKP